MTNFDALCHALKTHDGDSDGWQFGLGRVRWIDGKCEFLWATQTDIDAAINKVRSVKPPAPEGMGHKVVLNGHQLAAALEFVNPDGESDLEQRESDLVIAFCPQSREGDDLMAEGYRAWYDQYPEEGCIELHVSPVAAAQEGAKS